MTKISSTHWKPVNEQDRKEAHGEANKSSAFFPGMPCDKADRLKACRKRPATIIHAAFQQLLDEMRLVVETAGSSKPSGLLIMGDSDSGKSTVLNYFCKMLEKEVSHQHASTKSLDDDDEKPLDEIPVKPAFLFSVPEKVTAKVLLRRVLRDNGVVVSNGMNLGDLVDRFCDKLRQLNTRVILVDEFHDIGTLGAGEEHLVLKVFKEMTNILSIPIIAAGTRASRIIAESDEQVWTRFQPVLLNPFIVDANFRNFLATYEQKMGVHFANPMPLNDKKFLGYLHARTNGLVGQVTYFLGKAYEEAVLTDAEGVTQGLLEKTLFTPLITAMSNQPRAEDLVSF